METTRALLARAKEIAELTSEVINAQTIERDNADYAPYRYWSGSIENLAAGARNLAEAAKLAAEAEVALGKRDMTTKDSRGIWEPVGDADDGVDRMRKLMLSATDAESFREEFRRRLLDSEDSEGDKAVSRLRKMANVAHDTESS